MDTKSFTCSSKSSIADNDNLNDDVNDDDDGIIQNELSKEKMKTSLEQSPKMIRKEDDQLNEQFKSSLEMPKAPPRRKHNNRNKNIMDSKNVEQIKNESDFDSKNIDKNDEDIDGDKLSLHSSQKEFLPQSSSSSSSMLVHSISLIEPSLSSSSSFSDCNNRTRHYAGWDTFKKYRKHKIFDLRNDAHETIHHGSGSFISLISESQPFFVLFCFIFVHIFSHHYSV